MKIFIAGPSGKQAPAKSNNKTQLKTTERMSCNKIKDIHI